MREVYRILDANFNRAREALRVIEDFARFGLDDGGLSASAKDLRGRLQEAYRHFPGEALLSARDTPGDVGSGITTAPESQRADSAAVVAAACKRLSEALRTLEEYAKVASPPQSADLKALRYAAYGLEQRISLRLSAGRRFGNVRLYVLLTASLCRGNPLEVARAAIAGGADCIQVREKEMPDRALVELARRARELTLATGALLMVNDRPDVAAAVGADGVHLGQHDLPVADARRVLPAGAIVGKSTHSLDQARAAVGEGADYISLGPIFPSTTKDAGPPLGLEWFRQAAAEISLPHLAVGGITLQNVGALVAAGCRRVAVCSAVIAAADPAAAAAAIKRQLPPPQSELSPRDQPPQ
jgi:thiamine-phosphate pyrophosphorylase